MRQRNKGTGKRQNPLSAASPSTGQPPARRVHPFTLMIASVMISLSVLGGFAMSCWPQAFGLQGSHPAIGFGLAALAAFRLYALWQELRRQAADVWAMGSVRAESKPCPPAPPRRARERG
jgi:hypothetical protein